MPVPAGGASLSVGRPAGSVTSGARVGQAPSESSSCAYQEIPNLNPEVNSELRCWIFSIWGRRVTARFLFYPTGRTAMADKEGPARGLPGPAGDIYSLAVDAAWRPSDVRLSTDRKSVV